MQRSPTKRHGTLVKRALIVLVLLVVGLAFGVWFKLFREEPQDFSDVAEQFKYGSIGNEGAEGLPYWVWLVLPRLFPEYLPKGVDGNAPGGYAALGLVWEPGQETPVGLSKKTIGFPRIAINCAFCHSGSYRKSPDDPPTVVPTAPANRLDVQGYIRFLSDCAADPRFNADSILPVIEYNVALSPLDRWLYRQIIIPATRTGLLKQKERMAWTNSRPPWGRGRIDPFNPVKFFQLKLDPARDPSIGNSDMEPLWNMGQRDGWSLHWDGLNTSLTEVAYSGAIGDGATPSVLPVKHLDKLVDWLKTKPPPAYPFPVDDRLAVEGKQIFQKHCAGCHAFGGERTGKVISLQEIGTDPHRLGMWSQEAADRYNSYYSAYPWGFKKFARTNGYVAVGMDGLWLRAPYLHNGSVPTLKDLLEPAAKRPKKFFRGYDVYDPEPVGFISEGKAVKSLSRRGLVFEYDTTVAGNGNSGHEGEAYGTTLTVPQKRALLEYLKTQ